jgi:hypothetical protein
MQRYLVYGAVLESAVPFPDLPIATPGAGAARWRIERYESLPPMHDEVCLGAERLYAEVHARLFAHREGWRIVVDDTGSFELGHATTVSVVPRIGAWDDFIRAHLLGRVLATLQYREGWLPLHASAVATPRGTIAFLGPKGVGKTSMAAALVRAGALLVTDDTLPVEPVDPPMAWPGLHTLRVRDDAREGLGLGEDGERTRDGKLAMDLGGEGDATPRRLMALCLLAPSVDLERDAPITRTRFTNVTAAAAVMAHVKCGAMLGGGAAGTLLSRIAGIVRSVPVYQLSVTRDLTQLPVVAATLMEWTDSDPTFR